MGEREVELALVDFLDAAFANLRDLKGRCLVPVSLHRFAAVERRRRHGTAGRAVNIRLTLQKPSSIWIAGSTDVL